MNKSLVKAIRNAESEKEVHTLVKNVDLSKHLKHWNIKWNATKQEYDNVVHLIGCVGVHRMPLDNIKMDFSAWV